MNISCVPIVEVFCSSIFLTVFAQQDNPKSFGGVGAMLSRHHSGYVRVDAVVPGGPADRAGLKSGEWLFSVNDSVVHTRSLAVVIGFLRGEVGTAVKVGVIRGDSVKTVRIVRASVLPWGKKECIEGDCTNGPGRFVMPNGDTIACTFIEGAFDGVLTHTRSGGERVTSKFAKGVLLEEPGTIIYPDGKKYLGSIDESVAHGIGTMTLPDGTVRSGLWILGRFISGCYSGNCESGEGTEVLDHGMMEIFETGMRMLPRIFYEGKAQSIGWSSMEQFEEKLAKELADVKKEFEEREAAEKASGKKSVGIIWPEVSSGGNDGKRFNHATGEYVYSPRYYSCHRCQGTGKVWKCTKSYDVLEENTYSSVIHRQSNLVSTKMYSQSNLNCDFYTCEWCGGSGKLEY
jgi:hypothetical protein